MTNRQAMSPISRSVVATVSFLVIVLAGALDASPPAWYERAAILAPAPSTSGAAAGGITLSRDALHLAYVRHVEGQTVLVVDGIAGSRFDDVDAPVFGPRGAVAYVARRDDAHFLVRSRYQPKRLEPGARITDLQFLPKRSGPLYVLRSATVATVYLGDSVAGRYEDILEGSIRAFPGSSDLAFVATRGGKPFLVVGPREFLRYDEVSPPLLGASGHFVSIVAEQGRRFILDASRVSAAYDQVSCLVLDPSSGRYAYAAKREGAWKLIKAGVPDREIGRPVEVCIAPGGDHVAVAYARGHEYFVARDTITEGPFETVVEGTLQFSADGRHLAYEAERHDEFFVVLDGREHQHFSDVVNGSIRLSPDASRFAYLAEHEERQFAVVDGHRQPGHAAARSLELSPDGRHVAYVAEDDGRQHVFVDGVAGSTWESIVADQIQFDSDRALRFIGQRAGAFYRVTVAPTDATTRADPRARAPAPSGTRK